MTTDDEFATDFRPGEAPTGVIVSALRWDILNEWVRYLNDETHPDKTVEMAYVWGFINRDFGGDALRCLWSKHETNYPLFAEAVWLHIASSARTPDQSTTLSSPAWRRPRRHPVPIDRELLSGGLPETHRNPNAPDSPRGTAGLRSTAVGADLKRRRPAMEFP